MGAERGRAAEFGKLENGLRQAGDWYRWGEDGRAGFCDIEQRRRYGLVRPIGDVIAILGQQSRA